MPFSPDEYPNLLAPSLDDGDQALAKLFDKFPEVRSAHEQGGRIGGAGYCVFHSCPLTRTVYPYPPFPLQADLDALKFFLAEASVDVEVAIRDFERQCAAEKGAAEEGGENVAMVESGMMAGRESGVMEAQLPLPLPLPLAPSMPVPIPLRHNMDCCGLVDRWVKWIGGRSVVSPAVEFRPPLPCKLSSPCLLHRSCFPPQPHWPPAPAACS